MTSPSTAEVSWLEQPSKPVSCDSYERYFCADPLSLHWLSLSILALSSVVSLMACDRLPAWILVVWSLALQAP